MRQLKIAKAFTLVEVMVAMLIIALLAAILTPTVNYAMRSALATRAQARLDNLSNGVEAYKTEFGYYPGRRYSYGTATGSQVLAACLFGYDYSEMDNSPEPSPCSTYATYHEDDSLVTMGTTPKTNSLSDGFWVDEMAICYYVSRSTPSNMGQTSQFTYGDNSVYTDGTADAAAFGNFISNSNYNLPYNDNTFLLITAGADREFFTNDDGKNW